MFPPQLRAFFDKLETAARGAGFIAGFDFEHYITVLPQVPDMTNIRIKSGRHMKFPYTLSAKIAQFPIFFYLKNNNIWMYYPFGCLTGLYFFTKIHKLSNSEANQRSWAESQRKIAEKEQHH